MRSTRLTGRKRWATERFRPQKKGRRRWQDQKRQGYQNHADNRRKRYAVVSVHAFGESGGGQCLGELGGYSRDEKEAEMNALQQGGGTKSNVRSAGSSTSDDSLCATSITTISSKGLYNSDAYLQFSRGFETASNRLPVFGSDHLPPTDVVPSNLYRHKHPACSIATCNGKPPKFDLTTRLNSGKHHGFRLDTK